MPEPEDNPNCKHPDIRVTATRTDHYGVAYGVGAIVHNTVCRVCGWRRVHVKARDPLDSEVGPWMPPNE